MKKISEPEMSRTIYDSCLYNRTIQQNKQQENYYLKSRLVTEDCEMNFPGYIRQSGNAKGSTIDIESSLRNLDYPRTKCAEYQTFKTFKNVPKVNFCQENYQLISENTRDLKPCNNPNLSVSDRFEPLIHKVQDPNKIQTNDYIGQNSRNFMKDYAIKKFKRR
jgi:hypothetical protein